MNKKNNDFERNRNFNNSSNNNTGSKGKKWGLDSNFDLEKSYFIRSLSEKAWGLIRDFISDFLKSGHTDMQEAHKFFSGYPGLKKGDHNIVQLRKVLDEVAEENKTSSTFFDSYKALNNYITTEFLIPRPAVFEVHFFPSEENEDKVVNMLRTCKKTLDIAIFSLTNDKIFYAIEEVWNNGVEVRVITDDECCKHIGSDIYKLAAMGIEVKTDDSQQFHMHHKFAVIDHLVVVTGSFNWTSQAVKSNQENIMFLHNSEMAKKYTEEYNRLWKSFQTTISKEEALQKVDEEQENRKKRFGK